MAPVDGPPGYAYRVVSPRSVAVWVRAGALNTRGAAAGGAALAITGPAGRGAWAGAGAVARGGAVVVVGGTVVLVVVVVVGSGRAATCGGAERPDAQPAR